MKSLASSPKPNGKNYFEEITSFDLYQQLTYMSSTAAAGISRSRTFQLARDLVCPAARFFRNIQDVAENLRYNYPDAVRLVGETAKPDPVKTFLLRLSDALRSGEPLPGFLEREAAVMGEAYENDYARSLESLKQWNDAYSAVTVSSSLIVIINMVASMIYNIGETTMMMMVLVAVSASFGIAWILLRAGPPDQINVPLAVGSDTQKRTRQLFFIFGPAALLVGMGLFYFNVDKAIALVITGLVLVPVGWVARQADIETVSRDNEINSFLRSLGGTATSRGTTLSEALAHLRIDSFPALQPIIRKLDLRLKSFGKPPLVWDRFGFETGSKLAQQAVGVFYQSVNLGGDPERIGKLTSAYSMRIAMLRQRRRGVAATFSWLIIVMHTVMTGLMIFLLGILQQFALKLMEAQAGIEPGADAASAFGTSNMFNFNTDSVQFMSGIVLTMVLLISLINAFAIVASQGAHLVKTTFYLSILLIISGVCYLTVPGLVLAVMK